MQNKNHQGKQEIPPYFVKNKFLCSHCGNPLSEDSPPFTAKDAPIFCCLGCRTVYEILNARGLSQYYSLKKKGAWVRKASPVSSEAENFAYLDDPEFLKKYTSSGAPTMEFYLEGVHCVACLWLIEKLPELVEGVTRSELDLGKAVTKISIRRGASFARVAEELSRLGYRPHPIQKDEDAERLQKRENRSQLVRLGVAGACTGNLMLMAVSLYGGATGSAGALFRWVSFLLFLPVLFYCALPFYQSAYSALRTRSLSIDVPIVLAILIGSIASAFYLIAGGEPIYFDSLSALVFLLLASRFVLRRIQQGVLSSSHLLHFLTPSYARRWNGRTETFEQVRSESLKIGDSVEVRPGEAVPVDGTVLKGHSSLNCALLTGESLPQSVREGDEVFAGTLNESAPLEVAVKSSGNETRLGRILREIESGRLKKAPIVTWADQLSQWFVLGVILLASAVFLLNFRTAFSAGLTKALALVIVTCPCALALATPLAMSVSLGKAARRGMLIKGADTIERLSQAGTVMLDKTGTLTQGRFEVLSWMELADLSSDLDGAVLALESRSKHPVAKALVRHLSPKTPAPFPEVEDFQEILGRGVEGKIAGHLWEIGAMTAKHPHSPSKAALSTRVGVRRDGRLVAVAELGDELRPDSKAALKRLKKMGLLPLVISGDREEAVKHAGAMLDLPEAQLLAQVGPEEKKEIVQKFKKTLMVGDGANDALALCAADVGVAVRGSMEVSLRAADVYLSEAGVTPVADLIEVSRETMKVIRRNFIFSICYNLAGAVAALTGWVNPLFAAVLMPLSSLTVFSSSLLGTRILRKTGRIQP
ncbi:MAG: heavy metal translocating P-type ATPase [bacterium]